MNHYRFVLADDHHLIREGLKRILEGRNDLKVVGEASNGLELLNLLRVNNPSPHVVILDISMPVLRGIEAIHEVKSQHPKVKIMVLTMHKDKEHLYQAISAGADAYLLKEDIEPELFSAIDAILCGKIYISPLLSEMLKDDWARTCRGENKFPFESEGLSTREREVLKLIAEGKSNKDIAEFLCISVRTVEHHRANIMTKLKVKKMADLVKYAVDKGYV